MQQKQICRQFACEIGKNISILWQLMIYCSQSAHSFYSFFFFSPLIVIQVGWVFYHYIFCYLSKYTASLQTRSWTWTSSLNVERINCFCVWRLSNLGVSILLILLFCSFLQAPIVIIIIFILLGKKYSSTKRQMYFISLSSSTPHLTALYLSYLLYT